jgi:YtkA-like
MSTSSEPALPASPSARSTDTATATPSTNVRDGVRSERGLYVGSWSSAPGSPPINVVHEWVLHIETSDGDPVEGATIAVDGDMPAHGHGMPTRPQVTAELGGGDYRVEGMAFQMGGYWIVDVTITSGGQTDLIRFGLEL